MTTYREALKRIFQRTDHERGARPPYKKWNWRLARVEELLEQLGDPQKTYPSVHIAGTKGKGSTTAMVDAILRAAGYRTGMYTSPHLHTFRERIQLQGQPISERDLITLMEHMQPILEQRPEVTVFEIITALAMWHFARHQVEFGIFEVGLGGRLDATNILTPMVCAITSISLDHTMVLGDTLEAIATEKAGIIKPGVPVVVAPQRPEALSVIRQIAQERGSELILAGQDWDWQFLDTDTSTQRLSIFSQGRAHDPEYPDLELPLLGHHQLENACTAVATIELLKREGVQISKEAVRLGLEGMQWPGRMQILGKNPLVVVDGAHNPYSVKRLLDSLESYLDYERVLLIFGAGRTHNPETLLDLLQPISDRVFVTQADHPKATSPQRLACHAAEMGHSAQPIDTVEEALRQALDEAELRDLVLVTGSLFVVAEAQEAWVAFHSLPPFPSDPPGVY